MSKYRIDPEKAWNVLEGQDTYLQGRIHLVACGGTALTIQNIKPSTKDIDFIVPVDKEYIMLGRMLRKLGYKLVTGHGWSRRDGLIFDLFRGNRVFTTELLESPLKKGNSIRIRRLKRIFVEALNDYDLIISKIFRGMAVDFDDCLGLVRFRSKALDIGKLEKRYRETARFKINEKRVLGNFESFLKRLKEK